MGIFGSLKSLSASLETARRSFGTIQSSASISSSYCDKLSMPPNPALQLTASRARSFGFETLVVARSRQLNAKPLAGAHQSPSHEKSADLNQLPNPNCPTIMSAAVGKERQMTNDV